MKKTIINYNHKSTRHGYQEWYWFDELTLRGNYKNDSRIGYVERHELKETTFYIR